MKKALKLSCLLILSILCLCCKQNTSNSDSLVSTSASSFTLPNWAKNAVIYEVNIRQFTPEGTFEGLIGHLDRLDEMGIDILWLMPIYPISEAKRKATNETLVSDIKDQNERKKYFGSPYAVADYKGVNPDLGTEEDFKELVRQVHQRGMKIILDYVPNHTGWDNQWITDHPDWYTKDDKGNIIDPIDPGTGQSWGWTDVADLDYSVTAMRDAQIDALKYWVGEMDVDGFRHDVAHNVPLDFWEEATEAVLQVKSDVFLLAEAEQPELRTAEAFHADYGWEFHHLMNDIAKGEKNTSHIDDWMARNQAKNDKGFHIHFTSNHDENTWGGTVFDRMGSAHKALAVLACTFDGMPLLYGGQEEPLRHRLEFFTKDDIGFKNYEYAEFYKTLFDLKDKNEAIWNGSYGGELVRITDSDDIHGFMREKNGDVVSVLINLSDKTAETVIPIDVPATTDIFTDQKYAYKKGQTVKLHAWPYQVGSTEM